ncbi:MAG TPA: hypothetical protein VKQ28_04455 [Candidatus Acidoferrum sp.]|nr:hypothetical protein [Candidatus Acidoferrum sp.]
MTRLAFDRIYEAVTNPEQLQAAYNDVLGDLFCNPFWEEGSTALRRILWNKGQQARAADPKAFGSPGLYLWGIEERPIYIGMTRSSFSHRFSRYIWSKQSQCELARQHEAELISKGIDGFPMDITVWYAKNFRGTKVRLLGAVRFAQEGVHKIWFVLFPHAKVDEIRPLEKALIPIAEKWNERGGLRPLLNIESAHL